MAVVIEIYFKIVKGTNSLGHLHLFVLWEQDPACGLVLGRSVLKEGEDGILAQEACSTCWNRILLGVSYLAGVSLKRERTASLDRRGT